MSTISRRGGPPVSHKGQERSSATHLLSSGFLSQLALPRTLRTPWGRLWEGGAKEKALLIDSEPRGAQRRQTLSSGALQRREEGGSPFPTGALCSRPQVSVAPHLQTDQREGPLGPWALARFQCGAQPGAGPGASSAITSLVPTECHVLPP